MLIIYCVAIGITLMTVFPYVRYVERSAIESSNNMGEVLLYKTVTIAVMLCIWWIVIFIGGRIT